MEFNILNFLMFMVAYKQVAQSKKINKTEIKQKQRPTTCSMEQVWWHFTIFTI